LRNGNPLFSCSILKICWRDTRDPRPNPMPPVQSFFLRQPRRKYECRVGLGIPGHCNERSGDQVHPSATRAQAQPGPSALAIGGSAPSDPSVVGQALAALAGFVSNLFLSWALHSTTVSRSASCFHKEEASGPSFPACFFSNHTRFPHTRTLASSCFPPLATPSQSTL
jgi:hypothetical protein